MRQKNGFLSTVNKEYDELKISDNSYCWRFIEADFIETAA